MDEFLASVGRISAKEMSNPKIQRLLKADPDEIIDDARNGSLLACEVVLGCFLKTKSPTTQFLRTLRVLAAHVENGCSPEKANERRFHLAEQSFFTLCTVMEFHLVRFERPPVRPIVDAWPSLLRFAKAHYVQNAFPYKRRIGSVSHLVPGEEELSMILQGVYLLDDKSNIPRRVAFDPALVELATYVLTRTLHKEHKTICVKYFQACFSHTETSDLRNTFDVILQASQGKPEPFVDAVLTPFSAGRVFEEFPFHADILLSISKVPVHPFANVLRIRGVDALSKFTDYLISTNIIDVIIAWTQIFSFWKPQDGRAWLIKFLRCRLFHLVATHDALKREVIIRDLLASHLPGHLVDPFVIFECEGALSSLTPEDFSKIMKSRLKTAWITFINRFFEQYLFYCYFEVAGYRKGCYKCSKAPDSKKSSALLLCGACKTVGYCSKECQTTGWKEHKADCKMLKGKKHGPLPQWAAPIFRRRLAEHDARRHLIGFRDMAKKKRLALPFQCLPVLIDYRHYPPRLDVGSAGEFDSTKCESSFTEGEVADSSHQEPVFDDFRLNDGCKGTLVSCEYIDGVRSVRTQNFHWAPPYFCSTPYGTRCPDAHKRKSLGTPFFNADKAAKKRTEQKTAWSPVDEIAFRTGLKPEMILEGKIGEFRRKVLELIVREKAKVAMQERSKTS